MNIKIGVSEEEINELKKCVKESKQNFSIVTLGTGVGIIINGKYFPSLGIGPTYMGSGAIFDLSSLIFQLVDVLKNTKREFGLYSEYTEIVFEITNDKITLRYFESHEDTDKPEKAYKTTVVPKDELINAIIEASDKLANILLETEPKIKESQDFAKFMNALNECKKLVEKK